MGKSVGPAGAGGGAALAAGGWVVERTLGIGAPWSPWLESAAAHPWALWLGLALVSSGLYALGRVGRQALGEAPARGVRT